MNWTATRWILAIFFLSILLVLTVILAGILVLGESSWFCEEFNTNDVSTMKEFKDSTLYPYSGTWNSVQHGQTIQECVSTCENDATCKGFFRNNEDGSMVNNGSCYFYQANNVKDLVGSNVNLSLYFNTTDLILGTELPETQTDTYIKTNEDPVVFRSHFNLPTYATD